jgi:alcohol dehydrogenase YqhD (iron-dependent ADH family)
MENFIAFNPVALHFGKNCTQSLSKTLAKYGKRVLLVYGKVSIKKYGYYDLILSQLSDFDIFEFSGIKPNPVIDDVNKAIALGKEKHVDMVLAVGGGSVIDSAKVISVGIANDFDIWNFVNGTQRATGAIPLINVLTLAATGTEMNAAAVVQNHLTQEKIGVVSPLMFPKHSFLDPVFTMSVSNEQTAYGTADMIAHALEAYFGKGEPEVTHQITFGIIRTAIQYGKLCLEEPENYDYRANHMLTATMALNGTTNFGKDGGDWGVHSIGHNFSLAFDTPHGASLSLSYPAWMKFHAEKIGDRIIKLGQNVFNVQTVEDTILSFENYFQSIHCPIRLNDLSLTENQISEIKDLLHKNKASGAHHQLNDADLDKIVELMR